MSGTYRVNRLIAFMSLALAACGASGAGDATGVPEHRIVRFDTLVTTGSGRLGDVSDLAIGPNGHLWIADRINHRVLELGPDGQERRSIGREGAGPGEFRGPEGVAASDSAVHIFDFGNHRLQHFRLDGADPESTPIELQPFLPASVNARGALAVPTLGRDSSLVAVLRAGAAELDFLGEPVAPPPRIISPRRIREQALRGEMPVEFRNNVLPVLGSAGALWLVLQSEGVVQRYGPGGRLVWAKALADPAVQQARAAFFAAWEQEARRGIPVPLTATAGQVEGGDLWLLLGAGAGAPSVVAVLDGATGTIKRRLVLELTAPMGAFAVDAERGWLYVVLAEEAALLRAELP